MTEKAQLGLLAVDYWLNVRADSFARALRKMNVQGSCEVLELLVDSGSNDPDGSSVGKTVGFYVTYEAAVALQNALDEQAGNREPSVYFEEKFGFMLRLTAPAAYRTIEERGQHHVMMVTNKGSDIGFVLSLQAASDLDLAGFLHYVDA